jgi:hypothetical protein
VPRKNHHPAVSDQDRANRQESKATMRHVCQKP